MLIDFHTHAQPDAAAAAEFFALIGGDRPTRNPGTPDDLFAKMDAVGVSRTLIVPWYPAQDMVDARVAAGEPRTTAVRAVIDHWRGLNEWAAGMARTHPDRISSLVGFDPVLMTREEMEAEAALRLGQGACGLKIAPMFFDRPADDPIVTPIWDIARKHGVFVLSECSSAHGFGHHAPCSHPRGFEAVARAYPDVRIQLAHLSNGAEDEVARLTRDHRNIYADLSLRLVGIGEPGQWSRAEVVEVIRNIGADRVVYGTNYPIVDVAAFAETWRSLDLTDEERAQIGWMNAERLRHPVN